MGDVMEVDGGAVALLLVIASTSVYTMAHGCRLGLGVGLMPGLCARESIRHANGV